MEPGSGVTDLKQYLIENIDILELVSRRNSRLCNGRDLEFGDQREVERIVKKVRQEGNGFQDLIVALVLSESFRTK